MTRSPEQLRVSDPTPAVHRSAVHAALRRRFPRHCADRRRARFRRHRRTRGRHREDPVPRLHRALHRFARDGSPDSHVSRRSVPRRTAALARGVDPVKGTRLIALIMIVAGALGLAYGSFSYTKESHDAKLGPIELTVKDRETVNVPAWLGAGVLGVGVLLLVVRAKN